MKTIQVTFLTLFFFNTSAQVSYNEVCKELYQYTEDSGFSVWTVDDDENYSSFFTIEELITKDTTLLQQNGIYQFDSITEDGPNGIIIKKGEFYEFYWISNAGFLLPKIMSFLNGSTYLYADSIKLQYLNRIIELFKMDFEFKTNIVIEKDSGQFKYYIY